jgi:hypothetical protein
MGESAKGTKEARHCETRATQTLLMSTKLLRVEAILEWKGYCLSVVV